MQNKESLYPADWLEKAKKDLERVKLRLAEDDLEEAAVHLQQAIEKYLKGYLLSKGWKLQKTHDLRTLLNETVKYNPELAKFSGLCKETSPYYFEERYPFLIECPSEEEIKSGLEKVQELVQGLLKNMK